MTIADPLTSRPSQGLEALYDYIGQTNRHDEELSSVKANIPPLYSPDSIERIDSFLMENDLSKPALSRFGSLVTNSSSGTKSVELPPDIEMQVHMVMDLVRQGLNQLGETNYKFIESDREKKQLLDKKRLGEMDEIADKAKKGKLWNSFHKIAAAAGLIMCAATGVGATVSIGTIIAWCIGTGLVIDQLADDVGKKAVARQIANLIAPSMGKDPSEIEDDIANYLELATGLAIAGVAIVTANVEGAAKSIQGVSSVMQTSARAGQVIQKHGENKIRQSSEVTKLDRSKIHGKFQDFCDDHKELVECLSRISKDKSAIEKSKHELLKQLLHSQGV